ncbi:MAG: ATP-binding protein [Candidatus Dormibacteraeota bacterium]|nr:ATP-binding protein [Candidatus Dormibacteraeota bacterium]
MPDGAVLTTLLGHLAYRLGGKTAWDRIAGADASYQGSSTVKLAELLAAHSPCLILFDETLEYLNKALAVKAHDGNLAALTLTLIKELTTAVSNTPKVAMLASLTSSQAEDYASLAGEDMQDRLSRVVGRAENIVTPVEGDDIFPILHRRLFIRVGTEEERQEIAGSFAEYYAGMRDALPGSYGDQGYRDRIANAYPFHPELVDILTNRWGSLSGFQRTRGALRTLAHTVKALSQAKSKSPMILAGDMPLADAGVRAEVIKFAGDSYKAALNADIIRADSKAVEEDNRRGGQVKEIRLARGLATTAFLDSFGPDKVYGASATQLLLGVGRPGLSRGQIEDVRDALESTLWYMRLEGGRYRFTTEPNLNKVVLEREAAIPDTRVYQLVREAISAATSEVRDAGTVVMRSQPWVQDSVDLADAPVLTLGVLNFDHRMDGAADTDDAVTTAQRVLEYCGSTFRANKNSAMLVIADGKTLTQARAAARTLAALRDVGEDNQRLKRFNVEQKEILIKRLDAVQERLPQLVVMAYRHLALLGESEGKVALDRIDLGPARAGASISGRALEYLRNADRLIDKLAPAALLSARFSLLPDATEAVELDKLLAQFARLTRLPKLASPEVLRRCLADGVKQRIFGLASGSDWRADDAVLRFGTDVPLDEIAFQPGTWLVRAKAIDTLVRSRPAPATPIATPVPDAPVAEPVGGQPKAQPPSKSSANPTRVRVTIGQVPADKARDIVKVAILPLHANSVSTTFDIVITADGGAAGIPRETLELVVGEGLRQLGLDAHIEIID